MNFYQQLSHICLEPLFIVREELLQEHGASKFECDLEVQLAIFLASNLSTSDPAKKRAFESTLKEKLDWSESYLGMLRTRIHKLPNYDFEQFRLGPRHPLFASVLYRIALCHCYIHQAPSQEETRFLDLLSDSLFQQFPEEKSKNILLLSEHFPALKSQVLPIVENKVSTEDLDDILDQLDQLIGLKGVKDEIKKLVSFLKIQKERTAQNLNASQLSLHMVFSGGPGTGKTTVARLVAKILKALDLLDQGHLIETDRSGLIGQYIGHTEKKTQEVVQQAMGGLLFIDEAYALTRGSENDFGIAAIDTLVKALEDHREDFIVILAGYQDEMEGLIQANPGLKSRFNTFIHFPDFNINELVQIFDLFCQSGDYCMAKDAQEDLKEVLQIRKEQEGSSFANGRSVRNLFEQLLRIQALRLNQLEGDLTREQLMTFTRADLKGFLQNSSG